MADIMKIEINQATYDKLMLMNGVSISLGVIEFGSIDKYIDYLVNTLIKDNEEINKYIERYIKGAKGKCVCKVILGHAVVANHHFDSDNICKKCGIPAPITVDQVDDETVILVGHGDDNDINTDNYLSVGNAIKSAKEKLPNGGIVKLSEGEYR